MKGHKMKTKTKKTGKIKFYLVKFARGVLKVLKSSELQLATLLVGGLLTGWLIIFDYGRPDQSAERALPPVAVQEIVLDQQEAEN